MYFYFRGLKNNNQTESFDLKHTAGENMFACRFIKIGMHVFVWYLLFSIQLFKNITIIALL